MTIPSEGIQAVLEAADIIGIDGWPTSISRFTEQPQQQVAIIDSGGLPPEVKVGIDYPTVQVLVRGNPASSYPTIWGKAQEIFDKLQALPCPNSEYPELVSCVARTSITPVGYDENDRPVVSLNFNLITNPDTAGTNRE